MKTSLGYLRRDPAPFSKLHPATRRRQQRAVLHWLLLMISVGSILFCLV